MDKGPVKVRLTILESRCRSGYFRAGQQFLVEDLCPPLCHELWNSIYPSVYALRNGGLLDHGDERAAFFEAICPDGGRVRIRGEAMRDGEEEGRQSSPPLDGKARRKAQGSPGPISPGKHEREAR